MQTISAIKTFPNGTPVDAVEAKLVSVYDWKDMPDGKYGPTSVQNAEIQDVGGNKIRIVVWKHKDISVMKGRDVVISSGSKGGVKVKHGSYVNKQSQTVPTIELEVGGGAQFHFTDVYHQSKGTSPADPVAPVSSPPEAIPTRGDTNIPAKPQNAVKAVFGATVGMALNNVVNASIAAGMPVTEQALWEMGSMFIRVAQRLESGDLHVPAKTDKPSEDVPF